MKQMLTFLFLSLFTIGCKVSKDAIAEKGIDISELPKEMFDPFYDLYQIENYHFIGKDSSIVTTYQNGEIKTQESLAKNKDGIVSRLKIGDYKSYYENGILKENGNFEIGRYTHCCAGGICSQFYNYKIGKWEYYYANGSKRAIIYYDIGDFHKRTSCKGGDMVKFGKIDRAESEVFDENENPIKLTEEIIREFETVVFSVYGYYDEKWFIEEKEIIQR